MAGLKTKPRNASVDAFLKRIPEPERRRECRQLAAIMRRATGARPRLWGTGIVGFGSYHYRYASGREGDWFLTGFAPRKRELTVYVMSGFDGESALLKKLGTHETGAACLYLKRLEDVDLRALEQLIGRSVRKKRRAAKRASA